MCLSVCFHTFSQLRWDLNRLNRLNIQDTTCMFTCSLFQIHVTIGVNEWNKTQMKIRSTWTFKHLLMIKRKSKTTSLLCTSSSSSSSTQCQCQHTSMCWFAQSLKSYINDSGMLLLNSWKTDCAAWWEFDSYFSNICTFFPASRLI